MTPDRVQTIAEHVRIQAALDSRTYPRDVRGEIIYILGKQVSEDVARRCSQQILERVTIKEWDELNLLVDLAKSLDMDLLSCQTLPSSLGG